MARKVQCIVVRDYWDENGVRQPKGTKVGLSAEEAMDMVEAGIVTRDKAAKANEGDD